MRHRVAGRHFNRDSKHRESMVMNLVRNLIVNGEITTTKPKAKEVKQWADKLMTTAKKGDLSARRTLHKFFGKRDVVNTLVDRIAPLFSGRTSGFTTDTKLGNRRGDNTEMVLVKFVSQPEVTGTLKAPVTKKRPAKATKAASVKKTEVKKAEKAVAPKAVAKTAVKEVKKVVEKKASAKKSAPKKSVKSAEKKTAAAKTK